MTIGTRLVRWRWQAYVVLTMLAALLLPAMSEAGCLQAASPPAPTAISYAHASPSAPAAREAQQPREKPASRPRHSAICQHAHCGHSQVAPESRADLATKRVSPPSHPLWTFDRLADSALIAGPERPPQA
jgi:hypothetical protein